MKTLYENINYTEHIHTLTLVLIKIIEFCKYHEHLIEWVTVF